NFYETQVEITARSIADTRLIKALRIVDHNGEHFYGIDVASYTDEGRAVITKLESDSTPLSTEKYYYFEFPLISPQSNQLIGKVEVYAGQDIVIHRAAYTFTITIINAGIKTCFLWFI